MKQIIVTCVLVGLLWAGAAVSVFGQGGAIGYQGRLTESGSPANGLYDFIFVIYDSTNAAVPLVSGVPVPGVPVSNGLFTASFDFGPGVFTGAARWLGINVRSNGGSSYSVLTPRQKIASTPYAIMAGSASNVVGTVPASQLSGTLQSAQLTGTYGNGVSLNNPANQFAGSGAALTGLSAGNVSSGTLADARLSGNVALRSSANTFNGNQVLASGSVGIGAPSPEAPLHVAPRQGIILGVDAFGGGYTALQMDLSSTANGYARFQAIQASGSTYGNLIFNLAGGNVGIGTAAPSARLQVAGDVKLGGTGQFYAASGEENLRLVRGTINVVSSVPYIQAGQGFSVTRTGIGEFTITLTTPFSGPPSVTASPVFGGALVAPYVGNSSGTFYVYTYGSGVPVDSSFMFIAIGPR